MSATVDPLEVAKFDALASDWWDPAGASAPLHAMTPARMEYVADQIAAQFGRDRRSLRPFAGLSAVDVGCGGGLVAEPLARMGLDVTGVDAASEAVAVARLHAEAMGLGIDYRDGAAEALVAEGARFDVVTSLEVVEHVADRAAFLADLSALLKPGGIAILSTLNRTAKSFLGAIVGAEYVMRWLPRGTHDWRKFPTPDELAEGLAAAGLAPVDRMGMVPDLARGGWRLSERDLSVNYLIAAEKA